MSNRSCDEPTNKKARTIPTTVVSAFFTKASEKPKSPLKWETRAGSLLVGKYKSADLSRGVGKTIKLAAFDLDGTLITTKSGSSFPKDESDWKFFDRSVPKKFQELEASGWTIAIFSNQAGFKLTDTAKRHTHFKAKLNVITTSLDVPLLIYAATAHDQFRKPRQGMFSELIKDLQATSRDEKLGIDSVESFFVGDAAGRPAKTTKTQPGKDFSASDRKFALNARVKFFTPEEYFRSAPPEEFVLDGFDPKAFVQPEKTDHLFERLAPQEIVLFVGPPAAGKSTYFHTFLEPLGYERINQDLLKTRNKCLECAKSLLAEGRSVCIDNTNANQETRAIWLDLGKDLGLPVRVIHFTANVKLCEHNNVVRAFCRREGEEKRELLPAVAFTSFTARYQAPKLEEGFTGLEEVEFVFSGSNEDLNNWSQYWT